MKKIAKKVICSKCKRKPERGHATIGKHLLCFDCWDAWRVHSTKLYLAELARWVTTTLPAPG